MSDDKPLSLSGMPEQAMAVITSPAAFFRAMPRSGGYADPIVFLVVMGVAAGLIQIVLGFIGLGQASMTAMAATGLLAIIMLPVFLIIGCFIAAAIGFVVWRFMGSEQPFETAFRCVAYSTAIAPLTALAGAVPYLGTLVHVAWAMWLVICASVEVHGIRFQTARLVFGIIGVVMALVGISNEYAARNLQAHFEELSRQFGQDMQNKSPEEMGRAVGEFLKGLEQGSGQGQSQ